MSKHVGEPALWKSGPSTGKDATFSGPPIQRSEPARLPLHAASNPHAGERLSVSVRVRIEGRAAPIPQDWRVRL